VTDAKGMRQSQRESSAPRGSALRICLLGVLVAGLASCGDAVPVSDASVEPAAQASPLMKSSSVRSAGGRVPVRAKTPAPTKIPLASLPTPASLAPAPRASATTPASTSLPCSNGLGPGTPVGLTVSVRAGAAVVTWTAPDATTHPVQNWLLAPADQEPPRGSTITWQSVPAGVGCGEVSATVTGLVSGHRYAFWLEEVVISPEDGIPQAHLVGTAAPVVIP